MNYDAVIKEAFALAKTTEVILYPLEIIFEPTGDRLLIVNNLEDITATLETAEVVTFKATGYKLELPSSDEKGFQDLKLTIANTDLAVSDFLSKTLGHDATIICKLRPYLASDLSGPQADPPLILSLSKGEVGIDTVSMKASFADIINKGFLTEIYSGSSNPAL